MFSLKLASQSHKANGEHELTEHNNTGIKVAHILIYCDTLPIQAMTTNLVKFLPCLPEPFVQIPAAFLHQFLNHQTALLQVHSLQPLLLFQIGAVDPLVLLHSPLLHAHFLLFQHTITHNGHSVSYILISQCTQEEGP